MELKRLKTIALTVGSVLFVLASFGHLLLLGYAAQDDNGTTPANSPLTLVVVLWAAVCIAAFVIGVIATVRAQRRSTITISAAVGALVWIIASVAAFSVLHFF